MCRRTEKSDDSFRTNRDLVDRVWNQGDGSFIDEALATECTVTGRSVAFYADLGFDLVTDAGFADGHPIIMKHPSGVVLNLLGSATTSEATNILMDVDEKYSGYTHMALTVDSLDAAKAFMHQHSIEITGSFSFGNMSAIFIRDPDRNVIELDACGDTESSDSAGYSAHP